MDPGTEWSGLGGADGLWAAVAGLAEMAGLYWATVEEGGEVVARRVPGPGPSPCGTGTDSCSLRTGAALCPGAARCLIGAAALVVCRADPAGPPPHAAARSMAQALEAVTGLEDELTQAVRELALTYQELAMAYRTLENTGVAETREAVAERVLDRVAQAVGAEGGAFVTTPEHGGMEPLVTRALEPEELAAFWALAAANLSERDGQGLPFSVQMPDRHYLACPVQQGNRRLGVIAVYRSRAVPFTSREGKLLRATGRQAALAMRNRDLVDDLRTLFLSTVQALMAAVEAKDPYTCGHSRRVGEMARRTATAMRLDSRLIEEVHIAAVVHDVGKIAVDTDILRKPGQLTETEWRLVRQHPDRGAGIIGCVPPLQGLIGAVRHHHERLDGQGYPLGLAGDDIPLGARIIAVCDAYDAMTSARPYRATRSPQEAVQELTNCAGRQFDPETTARLLEVIATGEQAGQFR